MEHGDRANFTGLVLGCLAGWLADRLYRSHILQVNTRWKALAEIYTMHSLHRFGIHNRKARGKKEPGQFNP